jgi:hypothetical protein
MDRLSIRSDGEHVVLELLDANGTATVAVELDCRAAFAAITALAQAASALPPSQTTPLHQSAPVLKSRDPSFAVGVTTSGTVVLALRPAPFPSMEFEFPREAADKLIADLRKATGLPTQGGGVAH